MELKLDIEPGLAERFADMRECFSYCVHANPTKMSAIAGELDVAPSNLSAMLSGSRNLDPELVERYMVKFKDPLPALFWAAKFCQDSRSQQQAAVAQLASMVPLMQKLLEQAGKA